MGTVVVTGAAGSLGRRVVHRLGRVPGVDRIVAVDLVPAEQFPPGVEPLVLDLADPDERVAERLEVAMAGAEGVIHLAWQTPDGYGRPTGSDTATANQRALRRVLAGAAGVAPASLVHLSSATVYGAWPDNPIPLSEDAPLRPNPELRFAVEKAEAERALADWSADHPGVAVAVLRPAATVGSPERPLYRALGGTGGPGGEDESARPVQFLHVDDLADAAVLALTLRLRGAYNVAPDGGTLDATARVLAGGVARLRLPTVAARAVASWGWGLLRLGVPREARAYVTYPWAVAPDRLKAAGWVPRYTSEEALVATDDRSHWDDLPPGRRQNYTLLAALIGGGGLAAVAAALAAWLLRRRSRSR